MDRPNALSKISQWKRRWTAYSVISSILAAAGLAMLLTALAARFVPDPVQAIWVFVPAFFGLAAYHRFWPLPEQELARRLNRTFPGLEESTQLLFREPGSLNLLESMQVQRISERLAAMQMPTGPANRFIRTLIAFTGVAALSYGLYRIPAPAGQRPSAEPSARHTTSRNALPPEIRAATVTIRPPSYTGRRSRRQDQLRIEAEAGATVSWNLETTGPVEEVNMLLNNRIRIAFVRANTAGTRWVLDRKIGDPAFYQLQAGRKLSEPYQIAVIRDQPPQIRITSPGPQTIIDFGMPRRVPLKIALSDDYGLLTASLIATVASGKGESVGFREHRLSLSGFVRGSRKAGLQDLLNLDRLGMKPGDELFFYAAATDNSGQVSRTDIYTVTMPDTAELMNLDGLTTGVNLMPEYFRSQRQIIIDTERLLKERDSLGTAEFRNRSNNLGMDQKLLRLRYGKFLGEESESEVGGQHHEDGEEHQPVRFGDPESMIDAVSHKHDNSEDATFFEPAQKAQLKAVLTEMWKAELQLRTFKPQAALPFEYKALRLLKDLQQKSRAYVGKTGIRTPPLKPEKRLTGELDKVGHIRRQTTVRQDRDPMAAVRESIGLLEDLKNGTRVSPESYRTLSNAGLTLNRHAVRQPSAYLKAVTSMQKILMNGDGPGPRPADLNLVQSAFYRMLRETPARPAASRDNQSSPLAEEYLKRLNNKMN